MVKLPIKAMTKAQIAKVALLGIAWYENDRIAFGYSEEEARDEAIKEFGITFSQYIQLCGLAKGGE